MPVLAALLFFSHSVRSVPTLDTLSLESGRRSQAVTLGVVSGMTAKDYPSSDDAQVRRWTGSEGSITVSVEAALSSLDEEDTASAKDSVVKSGDKLHRDFAKNGGQTIEIRRAGSKIKLTVGYDFAGNFRSVESSEWPVVFNRAITAKAESAERAVELLTDLTIYEDDRVSMYSGQFPLGWTLAVGSESVPIPHPQDPETLESDAGKIESRSFEAKDGEWSFTRFLAPPDTSPTYWAKHPHPLAVNVSPDAKVTYADVVSYGSQKYLRTRGSAGKGDYEVEWRAWYTRTTTGTLLSFFVKRNLKFPKWPSSLPMSMTADGTSVSDSVWPEAIAKKGRTVTVNGATATFVVNGTPEEGKYGISYHFKPPYEQRAIVYTEEATKLYEKYDPDLNWILPEFKDKDTIVDVAKCKRGEYTWIIVRTMVFNNQELGPRFRRFEIVYTMKDKVPFILYLKGLESTAVRDEFKAAVQSFSTGSDEPPFADYPVGNGSVTWYLPYHQLKFELNMKSNMPINYMGFTAPILGGWTLSDGKTWLMFSVDKSYGSLNPMQDTFCTKVGYKRLSKAKKFKATAFGMDAECEEADWENEKKEKLTLVSVSHRPGVATHFQMPKGTPDTAWREFVAKYK